MPAPRAKIPPPVVALVGWLVPGLGYWLIGERARALVVGGTIVGLFVLGLFLSGIRVIEVPGYDEAGMRVHIDHVGRRFDRRDPGYEQGRWEIGRASCRE